MHPMIASLISVYPDVPFQKLLDIQVVDVSINKAIVRLPYRGELAGGGNAFHGGAISSLLDLTGALAAWSGHDPERGMKASTVTITTNYIAAALGTDVIATAHAVKRGKELIFCEVQVTEALTNKLVANGTMIYRIS
jgi:uncharacterized protein (TIGR00369 family)